MSTVVDAATRRRRRQGREGAALPIVLGILAVLLVIVAWFYTNTQLHLRQATNVINQTRAELIADGGVATAVAFLNQDRFLHPTVTSIDHAWRVYFNGAWAVGKQEFWRASRPLEAGGLPQVDQATIEAAVQAGLAARGPDKLDPFNWNLWDTLDAAAIGQRTPQAVHAFLPWIYVPRRADSLAAFASATQEAILDSGPFPFVLPHDLDNNGQLPSELVSRFTDVDNTGDGLNDSIWLPVPREIDASKDGLDNDLNGLIDEEGELALFVYWGGNDGLDNTGDGVVDGPDEQRPFLTMPLDIYYLDLNQGVIVKDTAFGDSAEITVRRRDPETGAEQVYTMYLRRPARGDAATRADGQPWPVNAVTWQQGGGYDAIDNDYSLIVNEGGQTRYWARQDLDDPGTGLIMPGLREEALGGSQDYDTLHSRLNTLRQMHAAAWIYAEPMCEIVGRMAIHVTDEASKPNMNVAGARYFESLDGSTNPMRVAINQGLAPHEYDLRTLPGIGVAIGDRLWNFRMGAPGGNGFGTGAWANQATPGGNPLDYDISLPGYGRVDDSGSLLYMLLDGLDNNADGLIDTGLRPVDGRYPAFEGMDDPFEYRLFEPLRNRLAERDGADNDAAYGARFANGADEIGELGDRAFRSIEQMRLLDQVGTTTYENLRNFLTPHSTDKNLRYLHSYGGGVRLALRDRRITGTKLDYNYAPADAIYRMLKDDWGYENQYLDLPGADPDMRAHLWDFGLDQNGIDTFVQSGDGYVPAGLAGAFGLGLRLPDLAYTTLGNATLAGLFTGQQADPELRAMQLAVNARDFADPDHARSELTVTTPDLWWKALGGDEAQERTIAYTRAGVENIRINEIMVRPVRRIEAEASPDPTSPFYPNHFSDGSGFPVPDFRIEAPATSSSIFAPPQPEPSWEIEGTVLGASTAYTTANAWHPSDTQIPPTVPNVVEFYFRASPKLPAGRYYLLLNSMFEGEATVDGADDIMYAIKYLDAAAAPSQYVGQTSVLTDLLNDPSNIPWQSLQSDYIGRDAADQPTGFVFLPNQFSPDNPPIAGYNQTGLSAATSTTDQWGTVIIDPDVYLVVAVRINPLASSPPAKLAVNFFDFSQEPDHEWIEVVNTAPLEPGRTAQEQAVDLSGWELQVEHDHLMTPTGRPLVMRIPEGTFIAPGGSLLLGVTKYDHAFDPNAPLGTHPFQRNGIGLAKSWDDAPPGIAPLRHVTVPPLQQAYEIFIGTGATTATVFDPRAAVDLVALDEYPYEQAVTSTLTDRYFANDPDKPWDRIVQLEIPALESGGIAQWVLAGGIFPNYPEYDGIDNDGDNHILMTDGVNSTGYVDESGGSGGNGRWRLPTMPADVYVDAGIDEGRYRREVPPTEAQSAVPGSFSLWPVRYEMEPADFGPLDSDYPPYLGVGTDPADWKAFVERRFFPGDCVVVTLYEGPAFRGKIADRITYTQQDVENRAIDDVRSVPNDLNVWDYTFPNSPTGPDVPSIYLYPINPFYPTTWPDNTMAVDFYRSLERWHPLYPGDRFGTSNRWEATDGNYDDWAPSTSVWERRLDELGNVLSPVSRVTDATMNHAFSGSPLRMNLPQRVLESSNAGYADRFLDYTDVDAARFRDEIRPALRVAGVADKTLTSPGDLLLTPLFHREWKLFAPTSGYPSLQGSQIINEIRGGVPALQDLTVKGVLAGQAFGQDRAALVGSGGVTASLSLTAAQADMAPLAPLFEDVEGSQSAVSPDLIYSWDQGPPPAWTPMVAFSIPGEDRPIVVDPGASLAFDPLPLFDWNALRSPAISAVFPAALGDDAIRDRWPLTAPVAHPYTLNVPRAVMYVSGSHPRFPRDYAPEALFMWNEEDGLANGEYDVYVQTAVNLEELRNHGLVANTATAPHSLFQALPGRADENLQEMRVDLTFYSDRNENNVFGITRETVGGITRNAVADGANDSFGDVRNVYPGADGVIHYGLVRVSNNYLALKLANRAPAGRVNRFVRVILAPHNRTAGRININTTETNVVGTAADPPVFSGLYGIPGVLLTIANNGALSYAADVAPPTAANYRTGNFGDKTFAWRGRLIHEGRTEHLDGRYYELPTDMLDARLGEYDAVTGLSMANEEARKVLHDRTLRYRRMANLITTRSDVFEIRVTAQSGYGVDGNGDGYIDYRSDTEFSPTAETRVRTVYER